MPEAVDVLDLHGAVMKPSGQQGIFTPVFLPAFTKYSCPKSGTTAHAGVKSPTSHFVTSVPRLSLLSQKRFLL